MAEELFDALFDLGDRFADGMESRGLIDYPDGWATPPIPDIEQQGSAQSIPSGSIPNSTAKRDHRLEKLQLVTQAMWEILRERHGVTDEELEAKILEVDLRDGTKDGRMARAVAVCGTCGRKTGVRHHRACFYCGEAIEGQHIVER